MSSPNAFHADYRNVKYTFIYSIWLNNLGVIDLLKALQTQYWPNVCIIIIHCNHSAALMLVLLFKTVLILPRNDFGK